LEVSISGILGLPVITDNVFYFPHPVIPNEDYYLIFNPRFWEWSPGAFILSAIVDEYYHVFTGDPTHYPVDFSLTCVKPTGTHRYCINNVPFGVSTPPNYFTLPAIDQPYWGNGTEA
jgi:hypothetical protein